MLVTMLCNQCQFDNKIYRYILFVRIFFIQKSCVFLMKVRSSAAWATSTCILNLIGMNVKKKVWMFDVLASLHVFIISNSISM